MRQAEIQQLGAARREHHVGRLQIPMDDTMLMGRRQRVGDLDGVPQCLIQWDHAAAQARSERLALDELHHEILMLEAADVGFSDVMQGADVRVIEP